MANQDLTEHKVVTAFLERQGYLLLVRRSEHVGTYQGRWSGISGYLEDATAYQQVLREIREETGLAYPAVRLRAAGPPLRIEDDQLARCWVVYPFWFRLAEGVHPRLDWENTDMCWVQPQELATMDTVPALARAWRFVKGNEHE